MENTIGLYPIKQYEEKFKRNLMTAQVNNSGISDVAGLQQTTTTLTRLIAGVVQTKYYELNNQKLSDFTAIEVGNGAYATDLLQYAVNYVGQEGQGWINPTSNGVAKDANHTIQIGSMTIKNHFWRGDYVISNELVQMGNINAQTFSIIEEHEIARKTSYDREIQKKHFFGFPGEAGSTGLLNKADVTINTTLMPATLANMTDEQFQTFLAQVGNEYGRNTQYAIQFNRLLMPTSDFLSLGQPFGQFGLSRLSVLEDALKRVAGTDFKIVHAKYCDLANAAGNGARYAFYNADADNLCAFMPKPYTPHPLFPQGALDLVSQAEAQYIPPYLKRTNSMLYADVQV